MIWLFIQTWIWILLAALLGLFIGWLIWRNSGGSDNSDEVILLRRQLEDCQKKCRELESSSASVAESAPAPAPAPVSAPEPETESLISDDWKPQGMTEAPDSPDDLKRISGIGPVIQKTLNGLGIYHFKQISDFTPENIRWVDNFIDFPGRIDREGWVEQARKLDQGMDTDFSSRYDKGET